MCNFNKQSDDAKASLHQFMKKSVEALGGVNFLLSLIEKMRETKPNSLMSKSKRVASIDATLEWNKLIFKDKYDVLEEIVRSQKSSEEPNFNILKNENAKKAKKILNMVKTLAPIEFNVVPTNSQNESFKFKIFDKVEDNFVSVNPIFVAMFFCSTEFTKKALKHEID